jgi:hypothetical protein
VPQRKVVAFANGMRVRPGAASGVSGLDEQTLVMFVDEVLGGWGLLKEWQHEREGSPSLDQHRVGYNGRFCK